MDRPDYVKWYKRARWVRKSKAQLRAEPLCRDCLSRGIVTPAKHADHIDPHKGDEAMFWSGSLQSLCVECHSLKTAREQGKTSKRSVSVDGTPEGWD